MNTLSSLWPALSALLVALCGQSSWASSANSHIQCNTKLNKIAGNIFTLQHDDLTTLRMNLMNTKILVDHGRFIGYPKEDGSFEIDNLPSDSYVVEIAHHLRTSAGRTRGAGKRVYCWRATVMVPFVPLRGLCWGRLVWAWTPKRGLWNRCESPASAWLFLAGLRRDGRC